ncbi:MAG: DUF5989 family protein [Bacteroidota bacterium]|jgi:hypothetical protein
MKKTGIFLELLKFMMQQKKYWLIPVIIVLVVLGILVSFSAGSVLSPFVYSLF